MCKHCEKIKEDLYAKEPIHNFMKLTAEKLSKKYNVEIVADDLDVSFTICGKSAERINALYNSGLGDSEISERRLNLLYSLFTTETNEMFVCKQIRT